MIINLTVHETGITEAKMRLTRFMQQYPQEVMRALKEEAETTMTMSKLECPVDTGALRSSGFVEKPKQNGNDMSIKLGYGGVATKINPKSHQATTSYAIKVHEQVNTPHKVGKAKFLEDPIKRRTSLILTRINASVQTALNKGGII